MSTRNVRFGGAAAALLAGSVILAAAACTDSGTTAPPASSPAVTASVTATTAATVVRTPVAAASATAAATATATISNRVSANSATVAQLQAAFTAAGISNAARWAREVEEYRPYATTDTGYSKLRGELAKYNPAAGVVDAIVATLTLP